MAEDQLSPHELDALADASRGLAPASPKLIPAAAGESLAQAAPEVVADLPRSESAGEIGRLPGFPLVADLDESTDPALVSAPNDVPPEYIQARAAEPHEPDASSVTVSPGFEPAGPVPDESQADMASFAAMYDDIASLQDAREAEVAKENTRYVPESIEKGGMPPFAGPLPIDPNTLPPIEPGPISPHTQTSRPSYAEYRNVMELNTADSLDAAVLKTRTDPVGGDDQGFDASDITGALNVRTLAGEAAVADALAGRTPLPTGSAKPTQDHRLPFDDGPALDAGAPGTDAPAASGPSAAPSKPQGAPRQSTSAGGVKAGGGGAGVEGPQSKGSVPPASGGQSGNPLSQAIAALVVSPITLSMAAARGLSAANIAIRRNNQVNARMSALSLAGQAALKESVRVGKLPEGEERNKAQAQLLGLVNSYGCALSSAIEVEEILPEDQKLAHRVAVRTEADKFLDQFKQNFKASGNDLAEGLKAMFERIVAAISARLVNAKFADQGFAAKFMAEPETLELSPG